MRQRQSQRDNKAEEETGRENGEKGWRKKRGKEGKPEKEGTKKNKGIERQREGNY
jgi:hypothetical protein